jgi:hypothetical protein
MEGAEGRLDADLRSEEMDYDHSDRFVEEATVTPPYKTERRAIVDTHRHPIGPSWLPRWRSEASTIKTRIPADQRSGLDRLSRVLRSDYAMPKQREGGRIMKGGAR